MEVKDRMEDEMAEILIVSKSPGVREFMAEELAGEGHLVVVIGNPASIEEVFTTFKPELVLLDFQLRGISLWNRVKKLRKQGSHPPVLTFTSYNGGKGEIRLEMEDGYGTRRFSFETLKQRISEFLRFKLIHESGWVKENLLPPSLYPPLMAKGQKAYKQSMK